MVHHRSSCEPAKKQISQPPAGPESGELTVVGSQLFVSPRFRSAFPLCGKNQQLHAANGPILRP